MSIEADSIITVVLSILALFLLPVLIISILMIAGEWKAFKKASRPGWAAIVPIYNIVVMLEIAELPLWYLILYFVPFANIYAEIMTYIKFAEKYGESTGFAIGMFFFPFIFFPILGFGNYPYIGNEEFKYCQECGTKTPKNSKYCLNCGYKFN